MSRAFVKEGDEDAAAGELPERPLSAHPNYVTPRGMEQLRARLSALREQRARLAGDEDSAAKQKLLEVRRDIRYFKAQIERAQLVQPDNQPRDEVHFGATVTLAGEGGTRCVFSLVGEDESDVGSGRISWASPLAKSLIGARIGDVIGWRRPSGVVDVEVVDIAYGQEHA